MVKNLFKVILLLVMVTALAGCACQKSMNAYKAYDLNTDWQKGKYVQTKDNFLVLFDASNSMGECYNGVEKLSIALDFMNAMNKTIPDLKLTSGIRAFGTGTCLGKQPTVLTYGMTDYSEAGFAKGLDKITCPGGITPISNSIITGIDDLKDTSGPIAVLLLSDGKTTTMDDIPVAAAKAMKEKYGDRVCIYTVLVGDNAQGKGILEEVAKIGGCGFAVTADSINSDAKMADFVEKIFLAPAPKKDWVLQDTFFDTDKDIIKPEYEPILDEAAQVMKKYPKLMMTVDGHCDIRGTAEYNQDLSERRANAVKDALVARGVDESRMTVTGYGFSKPAAPNDTAANMAKNRRVELHAE